LSMSASVDCLCLHQWIVYVCIRGLSMSASVDCLCLHQWIVYVCISELSFKNINIDHYFFICQRIVFIATHNVYRSTALYWYMTLWHWPLNVAYRCKGIDQSNNVCEYEVNLSTNEKVITEKQNTNC